MKIKALNCLIALIFSLGAFAIEQSDLTMVSYEQSWLDSEGTIALKNNTDEEIRNVSFQITYLDMSGNALDYKDFNRTVTIAPGMTKKLDIPAYEHNRNYHYYKTNDKYGHPAFKINFKLTGYNNDLSSAINTYTDEDDDYSFSRYDTTSDSNNGPSGAMILMMIAIVVVVIGFIIGMYVLVAVMAQKRNRNVVVWILLSIVTTPILMAIILLVIGNEKNVKDESYSKMQ